MSERQPCPGGARRPHNAGCVRVVWLASGEPRYHASLRGKFLGSYETRAAAQRAIDAARAALADTDV